MHYRMLAVVACAALASRVSATVDYRPGPDSQVQPDVSQGKITEHSWTLWPEGAPGAIGTEPADQPKLTFYPADPRQNTGSAVVICPGGGYGFLAADHEGRQPAQWLNSLGINAFVLQYRIAPRYHHPAPLQDAQRAIRHVRANADKLHVKPEQIGIWGFSAGGHLASTAGTHFDDGKADSADAVERASCHPDFMILCYPVISMETPPGHRGSRDNLLGKNPDPKLVELLSNEKQVGSRTPPTFIFQTDEDKAVPADNCVLFYLALRKAGIPAEMHIYEKGAHGVGLAPRDPVLSSWTGRLADWLKVRHLR